MKNNEVGKLTEKAIRYHTDDFEFIKTEDADNRFPKALGIDIGTTTISVSLTDPVGDDTRVYTIRNDSGMQGKYGDEHIQDAEYIAKKVIRIADSVLDRYPSVSAIGLTGQMHGIVYLNASLRSVSPLYTWQDGRSGRDNGALLKEITEKTGYRVPAGYGLATHLYLQRNRAVPTDASILCTIVDYAGAKMCGTAPLMHVSDAASLGFFDDSIGQFDIGALQTMGMDVSLLPSVTSDSAVIGTYRGVPVCIAIGDNQASFFGSVRDEDNSILVNYGTGSQISLISDIRDIPVGWERRPYVDGRYLLSGSALCGGRAYAALEKFFAAFLDEAGFSHGSLYPVLDRMCERAYAENPTLQASMLLEGTRADPSLRGSITNLSTQNFTPGEFAAAIQQSMADELYGLYLLLPERNKSVLVASGNGVRLGKVLRQILSKTYGMAPHIPRFREEAALGVSLFALHCIDPQTTLEEIKSIIQYDPI